MTSDPDRPSLDDLDDLTDPIEAVELLLLSAVLWGTRTDVTRAVELVDPTDFHNPVAGEVFTTIAGLIDGPAHDAATVLAELQRCGQLAGHHGARRAQILQLAVSAGATGMQANHYGALVIAAAYRRAYRAAAEGILAAADTLPEHDLWDYMSHHGWRIRAIRDRLDTLRAPKGTP